jgi:DNA-binding NarL/FixJ family response regulator
VTPTAAGWRALAEADYERAGGAARPDLWSEATDMWERLERPPLAAYCRWRQAEALVAAGAPREAEVLTLVARGLTNREVADELVISVKTASVHVSHILRKLDAPNRREAAAIAHRLAAPP